MARPVVIGLVNGPMDIVPVAQRRAELLGHIADAGASGCQIVMLPEFADHHRTRESLAAHPKGPEEVRKQLGFKLDSPWLKEVSALAKKFKMVVIPNVMLHLDNLWRNSCVVYGPEGTVLGHYNKAHTAPGECNYFEPGNVIEPVETPFGRLGLLICYDINFIETTRCHELKGADILLWTTMRQAENEDGLYRAGLAARSIIHGLPLGVSTYVNEGQVMARNPMSSILYNCFGQVIAGGRSTPGVVRGVVDLDESPLERRTWSKPEWVDSPSYLRRQRRPDLYDVLVKPLSEADRNLDNEPTARPALPDQRGDD